MPRSDSDVSDVQEQDVPHVLSAYVHDVRYFAALLRGVSFAKMASVTIMDSGLIVTTEEARTLLGTAYIFADIFDEYTYNPPSQQQLPSQSQSADSERENEELNAAFDINLSVLLECLNILGTAGPTTTNLKTNDKAHRFHGLGQGDGGNDNEPGPSKRNGRKDDKDVAGNARLDQYFGGGGKKTGMRLSYAGAGYPLTLLIAEEADGPTATCEITTFDPEPRLELPFDAEQTALRIILKSSWLRDALSELEPSCEKVTIVGNPPPPEGRVPRTSTPRLRLKAVGNWGSTEMDYPNDREVLEACDCPVAVSFSYKHSHLQKAARALQTSTKTSLRIDQDGLLSLQFLMPSPRARPGKSANAFVEFRCMALEGDD
ncbi:Rad1-domain-containing protein [Irpex rosettiformis]|uniref:Rad1-domain-containing protein n=1 Tax=Irpex rosettiformis TaxID=378272 RepID=A0ACB8TPU9_9APHY|nr:Rad1-domain-containing protein [Irpex rosettiformis]